MLSARAGASDRSRIKDSLRDGSQSARGAPKASILRQRNSSLQTRQPKTPTEKKPPAGGNRERRPINKKGSKSFLSSAGIKNITAAKRSGTGARPSARTKSSASVGVVKERSKSFSGSVTQSTTRGVNEIEPSSETLANGARGESERLAKRLAEQEKTIATLSVAQKTLSQGQIKDKLTISGLRAQVKTLRRKLKEATDCLEAPSVTPTPSPAVSPGAAAAAAAAAAAEVAAQGGQNMVEKENLALKAELGELRTLKQKLGEEHQKMEHERKAKSDAEAREAELKKRCESLRLEIDRILCDSDSAESKIRELKAAANQSRVFAKKQSDDLARLESKCKELEQKLQSASSFSKKLEDSKRELSAAIAEAATARDTCENLRVKNSELEKERGVFHAQLRAAVISKDGALKAKSEAHQSLAESRKRLVDVEEMLAKTEKSLSECKERLRGASQKENDNLSAARKGLVEEKARSSALERELRAVNEQRALVEKARDVAEAELKSAREDFESQAKRNGALHSADLIAVREEAAALKKELARARDEVSKLKAELLEAREAASRARAENVELVGELTDAKRLMERLEETARKHEQEAARLAEKTRGDLLGAEKNSKKLDEARANIRLRIADIAARNKMIASLKAGLATEEQRRKIAESEAEEAKRAKFEAVAEADANAKATKVLEKKLAAASVRHDKAMASALEDTRSHISSLADQIQSQQKEIDSLKERLAKAKSNMSSQRARENAMRSVQGDVRNKLKEYEKRIDAYKKDLENERSKSEKERAKRLNSDSKVSSSATNASKALRDAQRDIAQRDGLITSLSSDVLALTSEVASLGTVVNEECAAGGYLSNLKVLLKAAEVTNTEQEAQYMKEEIKQLKQTVQVLQFNVSSAEKQLAKYDVDAAKRAVKSRRDSMKRLSKELNKESKKNKKFQESSLTNMKELAGKKPQAIGRLKDARASRKSLLSRLEGTTERVRKAMKAAQALVLA